MALHQPETLLAVKHRFKYGLEFYIPHPVQSVSNRHVLHFSPMQIWVTIYCLPYLEQFT